MKTYTFSLACLDQDIKMDHKAQCVYLYVEAHHRYNYHCSLCDAEKLCCSPELLSAVCGGLLCQMFVDFTDFDLDIALRLCSWYRLLFVECWNEMMVRDSATTKEKQ
jgi:hypothetical protein